jgi:hypothetical protein
VLVAAGRNGTFHIPVAENEEEPSWSCLTSAECSSRVYYFKKQPAGSSKGGAE